jgi:hypothetical protein
MTDIIPLTLKDLDHEWLTQIFQLNNVVPSSINEVQMDIIGEGSGFMGDVIRLTAHLDNGDSVDSIILKLPTAGDNRKVGQSLGVYEREIRFYRDFQPLMPIRTPRMIYAAMEESMAPETGLIIIKLINKLPIGLMWRIFLFLNWLGSKVTKRYARLIEDLGHLRPGDQVTGCSPEDAKIALMAMAQMQATFLNNRLLSETPWIIPLELTVNLSQQVFRQALPAYLKQYAESLSNGAKQTLHWLDENGIKLMKLLARQPSTLNHGDFRLDNLFFDDSANEIVLCDWQTPLSGPLGIDLAYFLSASLTTENQSEIDNLLKFHLHQLNSLGVQIDAATLTWQYQAAMLVILLRVIPAEFQDLLDLGDNRGHQLAITWLDRVFTRVEKIQLDLILAGPPL